MSTQWPKSCAMKIIELKKKWDKKYGVEIKLKTSKTQKLNLQKKLYKKKTCCDITLKLKM